MARKRPTRPSKPSKKATAASITPKTRHVNLSPSAQCADQKHSRLMSLPQELRNRIYEYIFAVNITWSVEPVKYDWDTGVERALVPAKIHIGRTTPPNKDSIMPCRQVYAEMRAMQAAAYRCYWTNNFFFYPSDRWAAQHFRQTAFPDEATISRIRHFSFMFDDRFILDLNFNYGKWNPRVLPAAGQPLEWTQKAQWASHQIKLEEAVPEILDTRIASLDPSIGSGLTSYKIQQFLYGFRSQSSFRAFSSIIRQLERLARLGH